MYSRYSNISIPKNYGGSRFSNSNEPPTKTHHGEIRGASRSAHSPSFASDKAPEPLEPELEQELEAVEEEILEHESEPEPLSVSDACESPKKSEEGFGFDFSSIKSLLSKFDKDSLLILGLILLLMSDNSKANDDIVALLALLLLN